METKKSTGSKLADMMYGNPEQAAFGVYPQAGKRGQRKLTAKEQLAQIFSDDRAMELPKLEDYDLSVPTMENLALSQRISARQADLKRQSDQAMSPLEKLAGGMQAGRLIGSGMYQAVKSIPTAITKGGKAAEEYIAENIYKPNQPKAYEYAEDVGNFLQSLESDYKIPPIIPEAMVLQNVIGPATRQAGKATQQGARQGALNLAAPRTLNPQAGVIKMKGGNWLGGSVEGTLKNLKRPDRMTGGRKDPIDSLAEMKARYTPEAIAELQPELQDTVLTAIKELEKKVALNNWVDRNLTNYVKKEMATPEDPVRRLAEEGIVHIPSDQVGSNRYDAPRHRGAYGGEQLGKSEAARAWEDASDVAINAPTARTVRANESLYQENPWTEKLSPDDRVYTLNKPGYREPEINSLGFDHILDVLREDVNAGRIRPEQLNKVSMEQAVRRTYEYDQELAAKVNAARAAQREGLPVYKEYPEGYRWVELNKPGAFASESEAMGHSVRGYEPPQGHPDWTEGSGGAGHLGYGHGGWEAIKSGKAKVYSLVDSKGQPHVTVESRAPDARSNYDEMRAIENQASQEADAQGFTNFRDRDRFTESRVRELKGELMAQKKPEGNYRITQIKGKGNAAPKEDYLPFVQDFVKSGQWDDVGDLQNTGLYKLDKDFLGDAANRIPRGETSGMFLPHERQEMLLKAMESKILPERGYITEQEYEDALKAVAPPPTPGPTMEFLREMAGMPPEGMAHGGRVHFSDNPDVMQPREYADGGAVFGVYPMIGKRREDRQDRQAAKSFPLDLARGVVAGAAGMPGDIESLIRMLPGLDEKTILPTSEDVLRRIPFGSDTPVGKFASGLGILGGGSLPVGPAIRGAKAIPGALKAAARNVSTPSTLDPQAGVIKMKGGNWLGGSIEKALSGLRRQVSSENLGNYTPEQVEQLTASGRLAANDALNNWVDRNLTNYIKKEMATPEDPVRRLAEEGITQMPANEIDFANAFVPEKLGLKRMNAGFPTQGLGESPTAQGWERITDELVNVAPASEHTRPLTPSEIRRGVKSTTEADPWLNKVDPNTPIYYPENMDSLARDLGFDHIIDVLREDLASGRIRPEQLSKVSMEQAVRRTHKYDQEMAKRMRDAQIKVTEGMPVHKDYADKGYKWIELTKPADLTDLPEGYIAEPYKSQYSEGVKIIGPDGKQAAAGDTLDEALKNMSETRLEDALKYEGDTMGHCVGSYCDDVAGGKSRIFSLRDAKGEPHVTVEVVPNSKPYPVSGEAFAMLPSKTKAEYAQYVREWRQRNPDINELTDEHTIQALKEAGVKPQPDSIVQIKGKQNAAPNESYLPYVQDFVRSGQWADVGDLGNTGLVNVGGKYFTEPELTEAAKKYGLQYGRMGVMDTDWETARQRYIYAGVPEDEALRNWVEGFKEGRGRLDIPPEAPEGMAHGGRVHISDDLDVMQLELAGGGLVKKGIKAIKGAAESAGQKAPVLAEKDLTTLQDVHTSLGDRVRAGAMEAQKMMGGFDYQYDKGQRVFTKDSAGKNKPPYTIVNRTRVGNQVMREDHPEFGPGMGRPIIDPDTGKAMRTPYEPGYRVRMERGPDDWSEFEIPQKAIVGDVEMAGGGLVKGLKAAAKAAKPAKEAAVPLTLPRVRPTTKDIFEAAERVGKQQAGEFVKSPLTTKTSNLAGRSKKEVDRLKEMEYKLTPIKDLPVMKPYEAKVGEVNIALPGDQTVSDMLLESVDGIPVGTISEGGALFGRGRLADPEDKRAFWASNIGPAELFQKKVTELAQLYDTDMVTAYHLAMGQMSNNFAQHMADANLRAIDFSKLNKDKMNAFDRVVSKGYIDPTTKERVTFENWPGIASPEDALLAMKEDPKLRKWFNNRMKTEDVTKKSDLPYGKSIEWAMTEPELRNMEINLTGLSAGRMKPGAELIPDSAHQTYSHDIPGTALGRAPELSPFSISFPDATAFVREKYRPQDFTGTIQKVFPHQVVDEAYLDDMYKYYTQLRKVRGFNEGGAVRKYAEGGEITADDLILEERKL